MKKALSIAIASAIPLLISCPLAAQDNDDLAEALRQCREHSEIEKRTACYDRIGELASTTDTTAAADGAEAEGVEAQSTEAEAANATQGVDRHADDDDATTDFGLPKADEDYDTVRGTVIRCSEANNRRFYFYFDDGQVWKYLGRKRLRYKNCNTGATLTEDSLGFRLQLDGEVRQVRVQRVR